MLKKIKIVMTLCFHVQFYHDDKFLFLPTYGNYLWSLKFNNRSKISLRSMVLEYAMRLIINDMEHILLNLSTPCLLHIAILDTLYFFSYSKLKVDQ